MLGLEPTAQQINQKSHRVTFTPGFSELHRDARNFLWNPKHCSVSLFHARQWHKVYTRLTLVFVTSMMWTQIMGLCLLNHSKVEEQAACFRSFQCLKLLSSAFSKINFVSQLRSLAVALIYGFSVWCSLPLTSPGSAPTPGPHAGSTSALRLSGWESLSTMLHIWAVCSGNILWRITMLDKIDKVENGPVFLIENKE